MNARCLFQGNFGHPIPGISAEIKLPSGQPPARVKRSTKHQDASGRSAAGQLRVMLLQLALIHCPPSSSYDVGQGFLPGEIGGPTQVTGCGASLKKHLNSVSYRDITGTANQWQRLAAKQHCGLRRQGSGSAAVRSVKINDNSSKKPQNHDFPKGNPKLADSDRY